MFWHGPMGFFEVPEFRKRSEDILKSMIKATKNGATTINEENIVITCNDA